MTPEEAVRKFFDGAAMRGLSLYHADGGLLRSTRHALIGDLPV
jgi:hypothetical protein